TLSEVALARRLGRPVVALAGWTVLDPTGRPVEDGILRASTAAQAVDLALRAIDR
ncbi:dethiobiotin synthetase, partial [Carbonactinospora thermoautotrophica]